MVETSDNRDFRILLALFGLTGLLLLALVPCLAYADDYEGGDGGSHNIGGSYPNFGTVWYGPTSSGTTFRYGVVAYTKYDAAMYCLYSTTLDFDSLNPVKKQKLLNGSAFTSFANKFQVGKPETTDDWATDANIIMSWNSARNLYGETYCYSAIYTYNEKVTAKTFVDSVLNDEGGGSGGGGSGGSDSALEPEGVTKDDNYVYVPVTQYKTTGVGIHYDGAALQLPAYNSMLEYANAHGCDIVAIIGGNGTKYYLVTLAIPRGKYEWDDETFSLIIQSDVDVAYIQGSTSDTTFNGKTYKELNVKVIGTGNSSSLITNVTRAMTNIKYRSLVPEDSGSGEGGDDEPTEPPIEWPDQPEKPVGGGPDVPEPGDPTTPTPPDPVEPTPGNPWIPIPDDDVEITGDDFQDLLDALNEHCIHLQNSIQSNVSQLWDLQSEFLGNQFGDLFDTLNDNFSWLGTDVISASFTDLKDYLHQLFEWLADQMEFNINVTNGQYNDSSVVYWLKQIWSKLGEGINTQPADPVQDSDDWWAWLLALMSNFVGMLLGFGSDRLGDVTSALSTLTSKFPFSLPWDLTAVFALLDAPAQTPAFDLPCFAVSLEGGIQQVGSYHITLEAFDDVWENVRWIERISFVVMLIRSTDLFMSMFRKAVNHD